MPNRNAIQSAAQLDADVETFSGNTASEDRAEKLESLARAYRQLAQTLHGEHLIQEIFRIAQELEDEAQHMRSPRAPRYN